LDLSGDLHVEFLQAIPIFESERAFKAEHGADAPIHRWEAAGGRFWDRARPDAPAA
jgi:hypothetical protein